MCVIIFEQIVIIETMMQIKALLYTSEKIIWQLLADNFSLTM